MDSSKLAKLLEDNKKMRAKMYEYSEIITLIKKSIKTNEREIYNLCDHKW